MQPFRSIQEILTWAHSVEAGTCGALLQLHSGQITRFLYDAPKAPGEEWRMDKRWLPVHKRAAAREGAKPQRAGARWAPRA